MDVILYKKISDVNKTLDMAVVPAKSKNLNAVHYEDRTHNNVTFSINDDNSISLSGTSTGNAYLFSATFNQNNRYYLQPGTYTISGGYSNSIYVYISFYSDETTTTKAISDVVSKGTKNTFTTLEPYYVIIAATVEGSNVNTSNVTLYPQLEEGSQATDYESPFIEEKNSKRIIFIENELDFGKTPSKNLNTGSYTSRTHKDVEFTVNSDGTVSLSGTSTGNAYLYGGTNPGNRFYLSPGTYTLSGGYSSSIAVYINFYSSQNSTTAAATAKYSYSQKTTFTINQGYYCTVNVWVDSGINTNGIKIYPQVEKGQKATQYVSPLPQTKARKLIDIDDNIVDIENNLSEVRPEYLDVPFYYHVDDYLKGKCNRLNLLARSCSGLSDTFAFVTDMHWTLNAGKSPAILNYVRSNTRIDKLFCGGDICDFVHSEHEPYDAFTMYLKAWDAPIYTAIGNHEYLTEYGYDGRLYQSFNSIGRDRIGNLERNYFYVENQQSKIRYIFMNAFKRGTDASAAVGYEADQLTWLQNTALNVDTGWGIVVVTHYTHGLSGTTPVISQDAKPMLDILDAYTGNGEIIAVISGHTHFDSVNNTTGGIPVIVTTCDKCDPWISGGVDMEPWLSDRVRGTIKEQVIDLFLIDRDAKTISRVRVGCPIHYGIDPESWTDLEEETISYDRT